jgi:S1-C subfamily serine protease
MMMSKSKTAWLVAAFIVCSTGCDRGMIPRRNGMALRDSVVKIYVTVQRPDFALPWQSGHPVNASGSGFLIHKRRILTNAHIVSNARLIQVQKNGNPRRFDARVLFAGHDCDLAVLAVDDEAFFEGMREAEFSDDLPKLNDEVTVLGFPMGGTRLSITKGIVSRIDYSGYSHSGVDQHLVLQVDAAINPGNSGGPVIFRDKVVGLAFQVLRWGENIGYSIPIPVIEHFLADVDDGTYHGYPELGVAFMDTRNPALRRDLALPADRTGAVVTYIDPFGSAKGHLRCRDVLLSIDGYVIANDGTVELEGNTVIFAEFVERKQWGDSVELKVWRDGAETDLTVPLTNPYDPFIYRNEYDKLPEYYVAGGLVFCPLNREYLRTLGREVASSRNNLQLVYYSEYVKVDDLYKDRDEFVVLTRRLPHPVNTYAEGFLNGIVTDVNGVTVRKLEDVKRGILGNTNEFHVIKFAGMEDSLVMPVSAARHADRQIFLKYAVSSAEYFEDAE